MKIKSVRNYDLSKILKPYENKWVALSYDRTKVLGAGDTFEEARKKVLEKEAIFLKLPPYGVNYIPASS